ncbi:unnamed protein product [Alternaria alternata]
MSSWVGPSIYRIENHNVRKAAVQLKSGDKAEKANVILHSANDKFSHWQFVHVGSGTSGKDEFMIINVETGLHLTAPDNCKAGPTTVTRDSPALQRTHWNVVPTRNGTGTYWILSAGNKDMKLLTSSYQTADNTKCEIWNGGNGATGAWWYLELVDGQAATYPDIGKAPKPE